MSFTTDIKKEIINRGLGGRKSEKANRAGLSAFVRTSGTLGMKDGLPVFFLVSETEQVAEFFTGVFAELFNTELSVAYATLDKKNGKDKLVFVCPQDFSPVALRSLGLLKRGGNELKEGILPSLVGNEECKIAYIRGAFLGSGSCILPTDSAGYHLEIVFAEKRTAMDFCKLLDEFSLFAKRIERKDTQVVYMKSKEAISDFLAIMGAENALKKFTAFVEKRDEANNDNRARNCFSGNADKTAIAAVKQVVAIRKLHDSADFHEMSEELKALARARLLYPSKSLQELANYLGVSKSCLNHRMRKLMEMAEEL